MLPLARLVDENRELCEQLHRFSRITAARLVATLGVLPDYHANTIRIEVLTHLAVIACSKQTEPKRDDIAKWFRFFGRDNWISRQEDPVEDVFIGPVNTSFGTFRLFTGNFADGYFIAERLIAFLTNAASLPALQETLDVALTLLTLSDALAERLNLKRNTPGGGQSAQDITVPKWRSLEKPFDALFFSDSDLQRLAISQELLSHFFFRDEDLQRLRSERLWNSSLERHPLFRADGGVIIVEPSTLARTVTRWILEGIKVSRIGGWADTFFHQEIASLFANDVANELDVRPLHVDLPSPPENTPLLLPFVGSFDVGKPIVLLTYAAPVTAGAEDFDGFDKLGQPEQSALDAYLRSLTDRLEKLPNFSGGLIIVAIVTVGRGFAFGITEWSERWHVHAAPLHDWLMLAADTDCSALLLWKLAEHVKRAKDRYHTEVLNPSGLIALWSYWKKSEFWLLPKDFDIHNPRNLLAIGTDFGVDPRLESKLAHDIHNVLSHDGTTWITVQRLNPASLFPRDNKSRIYADRIAARHQRLVGYVETESLSWWVIAPKIEAAPAHRDILFQLWECVLQWIDRATDVIAKELSPTLQSIEIRIDLPDFPRWQLQQRRGGDRPAVTPSVEVHASKLSFTIVLYEPFLAEFNQPKNVAEQSIVRAVINGVERLLCVSLSADKRDALVLKIVGSEDARYFHFLETKMLEHLVSRPSRAHPLFISDEDLAAAQIGLAELVDDARLGTVITGKDECRNFLEKVVEKLWERIESQLNPFSREIIAITCFEAIDEINRDSEHWKVTTRAVLALNEEQHSAKQVLTTRRSQRSIASVANRILIETAQYSAFGEKRVALSRADHSQLLANVELLMTVANHRDAIAYGFLEPKVQVNPRGDIEVDEGFYEDVMRRYFSHHSDRLTDRAARSYETHFGSGNTQNSVPSQVEVQKFDEAFEAEFGFTATQLHRVSDLWAQLAIESQRLVGVVEEPEMTGLLTEKLRMHREQAARFLGAFSLPIRGSWDSDLPPRCSKQDVFPWRFRRNLSLLMRPLVLVNASPRRWVISAALFENAGRYITGNIYEGRLPDRFFVSKLRAYIGAIVHRHGHAFAERVAGIFRKSGYTTRAEIRLTELGAPRNPDLGDVDVLAWTGSGTDVFIAECKRLTPALTVREVIQRLEDFRGDEQRKDSLGKHLARLAWLDNNRAGLQKITGIPATAISFRPLLVTSELVPMRFFEEMKFPTNQVVSADDLSSYLQ